MCAVADGRALAERDVSRQILVLAAEGVAHPRADRGKSGEAAAGDERELRRGMVDAVRGHGPHERHLVHHFLEIGQQIGNLASALAAVGELPRAGHDLLRSVQRAALDLERRGLAVVLHQRRLRIEHVDGARPAADVDEDDALGLRGKCGALACRSYIRSFASADSAANIRSCCSIEFTAIAPNPTAASCNACLRVKISSWLFLQTLTPHNSTGSCSPRTSPE